MKKILISNIGNRNITYRGETFDRRKHHPNFREWTLQLLQNFDVEKDDLGLNILSDLLNSVSSEIDHVILFASNQVNEEKRDQDTLYEAEIMKLLIEEKYHHISVTVDQLQCKVTDNDQLLKRYRNKLKNILVKNPEAQFFICDAGGTPQQKSSLKIIAEYLLTPDTYEVFYVNPDGKIDKVQQIEYRNVIVAEQISSLIETGEYKAALDLRGFTKPLDAIKSNNPGDKLLYFGWIRFNLLADLSTLLAENFGKKIGQFPSILSYNQKQSRVNNLAFNNLFSSENLFTLGELLEKLRFLQHSRQYNEAILTTSVFYEKYLNSIVCDRIGYDLTGDKRSEEIDRLKDNAPKLFSNIALAYPVKSKINIDTPFLLLLSQNIEDPANKEFLNSLSPWISSRKNDSKEFNGSPVSAVNSMRNKMLHNGLYLTDEHFHYSLPYLNDLWNFWYILFKLPDLPAFEQLNQEIRKIL